MDFLDEPFRVWLPWRILPLDHRGLVKTVVAMPEFPCPLSIWTVRRRGYRVAWRRGWPSWRQLKRLWQRTSAKTAGN